MSALAELPNRRVEGWRWSDLRAVLTNNVAVTDKLGSVDEAGPLAALARALAGGDRKEVKLDQSFGIELDEYDPGRVANIVVPAFEQGLIVERLSTRPYYTPGTALASYSDIELDEGATLLRVVIQDCPWSPEYRRDAANCVSLSGASVRLAAGSTFKQFIVSNGEKFARLETDVTIDGEGASAEMNGIYLCDAGRHADLTSKVTLNVEGSVVRQLVRGVARKKGRGVFQGKFLVERAAQKTDAQMAHNALLLEDGAEIFAKPELEIYADDVQCAHGNTCGQLDEQAIFYARQRGLPEADARAMLTRAFLVEAIPDWLEDELRGEVETRIDDWLGAS